MDYLATYLDNVLHLCYSDMIINIKLDTVYLILTKSQSRAAAWFIFGNDTLEVPKTMTNAPIYVMYNIIKTLCHLLPKQ